ncbi:MAG: hypothetical protein M3521_03480 [Acidobacteriota bacterium]|jgi:hypothetical protein|nr:hypothetical protein [Acidobacteriota bacterium]MDQ3372936.1 hypothetical protein [Acidobacteriota bacterium]
MSVKVSQMTVDELREMIGVVVEEKLQSLFANEDDLEFTDELKEILARQGERIKNGDRGEALEDVVARLGLD